MSLIREFKEYQKALKEGDQERIDEIFSLFAKKPKAESKPDASNIKDIIIEFLIKDGFVFKEGSYQLGSGPKTVRLIISKSGTDGYVLARVDGWNEAIKEVHINHLRAGETDRAKLEKEARRAIKAVQEKTGKESGSSVVKEGYFKMHPADTYSYTVWKKDLHTGKLSHKEHLDNSSELQDWMEKALGKHATILVKQDQSGKEITYTDDGTKFVPIDKKK